MAACEPPARAAAAAADETVWDRDRVFGLIDAFHRRQMLWDTTDPGYYSRRRKADAWREVAAEAGCPLDEARRKINSLMAGFRREVLKTRRWGEDGFEYSSSWFAFHKLDFLLSRKGRSEKPKEVCDAFLADSEFEADLSVKLECTDSEFDASEHFLNALPATTSNFSEKENNTAKNEALLEDCFSLNSLEKPSLKRRAPNIEDTNSIDTTKIFGEFISSKLRTYDKRTRCVVEHEISNILFQADMGKFEEGTQKSVNSPK